MISNVKLQIANCKFALSGRDMKSAGGGKAQITHSTESNTINLPLADRTNLPIQPNPTQ